MSSLYVRNKRIYLDFTDQWNIRHQKSLKLQLLPDGKMPIAAKEIQKSIDAKIAYGTFDTIRKAPSITISRLKEEYFNFIGNTRDKSTKYLHSLAVRELIKFAKDIPIIGIDQEMMIEFRNKLLTKSDSHASRTLRSLSPLFRFAADQKGWIPFSPITRYTNVKVKKKPVVAYSDDELNAFFKWSKEHHPHFYNHIKFLYLTGFRSNESCTAQWKDLDLKRRVLMHYDDKLNEWIPYPIDKKLVNFFKTIPRDSEPYIFHYRSINSLDHILLEAREKIPLRKELKIHTLKVNYVRNLIDAGINEMDAHKLSHHKSIATTHRYYATFSMAKLRKSLTQSRKSGAVHS